VLTALLAGSGGPENPFTIFYLVNIVLAALVLHTRTTVWITTLSALCFAALFLVPDAADEHAHHGHHAALAGHLRGMWIAFAIAASVIAYFVRKISLTIAAQREQIAQLRESAAMNARFASLATLAAGAAHELGTPLGTIAVAAHELELSLAQRATDPDALDDARLIAMEVERCRVILGGMAARTAEEDQKPQELAPTQVFALLRERVGSDRTDRLVCELASDDTRFVCALQGLLGALTSLVKNGFDSADRDHGRVRVVFRRERDTMISFTVHDDGDGMAPEVAARAGEPFFTTKEPGHGMGLGLFLARAFAESSGGRLVLRSHAGEGTDAVLWLPRRPGLELGAA
jgi:two-component system sensor histidine kinase RegB